MAKTPEEKRAKLLRKIAKMQPEEFRKKLRDPKYVAKLEANAIKVSR
jgi:hypothetical protein